MGFQQGLSGLNTSAKALDVVGNNIANSNTVGFKTARAEFSDVFAASLSGGGASQIGVGATLANVAQQFTQGNITTTNSPLDLAINGGGFYQMSNNGSVTFSRNGQFQVEKNGYIVNAAGYRLQGYAADYSIDPAGIIVPSTPTDVFIDPSDLQPKDTDRLEVGLNLDSRKDIPPGGHETFNLADPLSYTASTSVTLYDTLGNPHVMTMYFTKAFTPTPPAVGPYAAVPGQWTMRASVDGTYTSLANLNPAGSLAAETTENGLGNPTALAAANAAIAVDPVAAGLVDFTAVQSAVGTSNVLAAARAAALAAGASATLAESVAVAAASAHDSIVTAPAVLDFDSGGKLVQVNGAAVTPIGAAVDLTGVMTANGQANSADPLLSFDVNLAAITQFGSPFGVTQLVQTGFSSGRLSGINVSPDGVIQGRYSNGQSRNMGQVVLAKFNNPNGLLSMGGNQWQETSESGQPLIGAPGTGSNGVVQSAAIEESNTDMTAELVNMITLQRSYQANAQTIKTQDSILQTLVNLR